MAIIVTKNDGVTDVTYSPRGGSGSKQEFVNAAALVNEPQSIMTDHLIRTGVGLNSRHTISVKHTLLSSAGDRQGDLIASLVVTVPNIDTYSSAKLNDVIKQLQCCLKNANMATFVAGASLDGSDLHIDGAFIPA